MPHVLTSHIVTSSADHIVDYNINTYGIDLQQSITQKFYCRVFIRIITFLWDKGGGGGGAY